MAELTLLELAQAGAHFGHHKSLVSPKSKKYIHSIRKGISLINLEETQKQLEVAKKVLKTALDDSKKILFVGTRHSTQDVVKGAAESIKAYHITERWFGGFLTNFDTFVTDIKKMNELDDYLADSKVKLTKKERLFQQRKLDRFNRFLSGVAKLSTPPDLMVIAGATQDKIAIKEALSLGVPVIAICDTDINPETVDYPIVANDDSPIAVKVILENLVDFAPAKEAKKVVKEEEVEKAEETPVEKVTVKKTVKKSAVAKASASVKTTADKSADKPAKKVVANKVAKKSASTTHLRQGSGGQEAKADKPKTKTTKKTKKED